jgi:heme-degrading monooxygenase HmoA
MIAQVFNLPAPPGGQTPDAVGPVAQAAMKETRNADGCEGLYVLASRDGSEGFAVVLWRDEAALNAMQKREAEHLDEIRKETPSLPEFPQPNLYDVTTA